MQQQQSNMVKPQKIGKAVGSAFKKGVIYDAYGKPARNFDSSKWGGEKPIKSPKMKKLPKKHPMKLPSKSKVMSSLRKTMGYK